MGIYDRDYYKNEGPSYLGSLVSSGRVCIWLIGINVAAFLLQRATQTQFDLGWFTQLFILDSSRVLDGQVWRLLSYAFLHANWMHILFNMLFLYWFGRAMEDLYGPREFLTFYLVSAVVGGLAFVGQQYVIALQHDRFALFTPCLGASGAVTAVMVLFACHYPRQVVYLFGVLPLPVWALVGFQVAQDLFGLVGGTAGTVAVSVHLGGAAFAFLYWSYSWRLLSLLPSFSGQLRQRSRSRPNLRVYHEEEPPRPTPVTAPPPPAVSDSQFEARVDALLEKIQQHGKSSLTESEREFMDQASEVYKRRRS
jgi:membrane associated rhomboid family serine protease